MYICTYIHVCIYIYIYVYRVSGSSCPRRPSSPSGYICVYIYIYIYIYSITCICMCVCIYIYIYIYIYICIGDRARRLALPGLRRAGYVILLITTVSFHNFKSQNFKLSVSNPKSKYVAYLSVLSQNSNCQGLGHKNKHETLKTDRTNTIILL